MGMSVCSYQTSCPIGQTVFSVSIPTIRRSWGIEAKAFVRVRTKRFQTLLQRGATQQTVFVSATEHISRPTHSQGPADRESPPENDGVAPIQGEGACVEGIVGIDPALDGR